jgi:hypothetical protein
VQDEERAEQSVEIEGVTRLRRGRGWLAIGVAWFAYLSVLIARLAADHGRLLPEKFALFGPMVVFAVGAIAFGIGWEKRVARAKPARLSVSAGGLILAERVLATRDELRSAAFMVVQGEGVVLRLQRARGGPLDLRLPALEDAKALRRALALQAPPLQTLRIDAKTLTLVGPFSGVGCLTMLAALGVVLVGYLLCWKLWPDAPRWAEFLLRVALQAAPALAGAWIGRAFVTTGTDGIELRAFRRRRFIPVHELVDAEVLEITTGASQGSVLVRLGLRGGAKQDIVVGGARWIASNRAILGRAGALAERVNELIANRVAAPDAAPFDLASLTRASRPMDAWLASLRALTLGADTFRDDVTGRVSALLDLVDDSAARALTRAAAAIALSRSDDPRARLRVAAVSASTASPRLRAVLEAVASNDDARLRDAMAALEAASDEEAAADGAAASPRRRPAG